MVLHNSCIVKSVITLYRYMLFVIDVYRDVFNYIYSLKL